MQPRYDVIIAGGGHNGLTAAAYLARAGRRVLVCERRDIIGGTVVSEPIWPGWSVSSASYVCSLLHPRIIAELELSRHGFHAYRKDPGSFTPLHDGRSLLLGVDRATNEREISRFSEKDVAGFYAFEAAAEELGGELADRFDQPDAEAFDVPPALRARLASPVAEFVEAFVESDILAATLATDGLIGTYAGPRDPGTTHVLGYHYAGRALGVQGAWGYVRGGMGAISKALAASARETGAEIRLEADIDRLLTADDRVVGVVLATGEEILSDIVCSNAHPRTTFQTWLPQYPLPPALVAKLGSWRSEGCSLKLNLGLGELPNFSSRPGTNAMPHHRATIHVAPSIDYLQTAFEDARLHGSARAPMLECFLQTPTDASLAPAGKHLLSIFAQYYPYHRADGPWTPAMRDQAAREIIGLLGTYAPNIPAAIEHMQLLAPPDLEDRFGLVEGHIFHGELLPGQIFGDRFPTKTPIKNLYLCGAGTFPGGCVSGMPGVRAAEAILRESPAP